jgi:peptidase C39-like protein
MEFVRRLASAKIAARYPLAVCTDVAWTPIQDNAEGGGWRQVIALPEIPADHIIVPSYVQSATSDYRYRFNLHKGNQVFPLNPVPSSANAPTTPAKQLKSTSDQSRSGKQEVSCHIDCWHSHTTVADAWIELCVYTAQPIQDFLLTTSIRTLTANVSCDDARDVRVNVPANLSQMQAKTEIQRRICSPTALAMALSVYGIEVDWQHTVEACYDPLTRAYGAWPLAIREAAQAGVMAAVETINSWSDTVRILQSGSPLVCSIRFAKGALAGAPLEQTGGHLVLLYGIEGNEVLVKDPAAMEHDEVPRRYKLEEFSAAWLGWRGAAYVFASGGNSV